MACAKTYSYLLLIAGIFSCLNCIHAGVNFTTLARTLSVETKINGRNTLEGNLTARYSKDEITISWSFNATTNASDTAYSKVVVRLCYGAPSALLRKWRKNNVDLSKSKTCYKTITSMPYYRDGNTTIYTPSKEIPGALYFVRVFVLNSSDASATPALNTIAYGQSTNAARTSNLFEVIPFKGISTGIIIAVVVISVVSYALLIGFFVSERFLKKNK